MLKAVADKQLLDKVYYAIYKSGFISSKELKDKFKDEFKKRNIDLTPKASLIENCTLYKVTKCNKRINGEKTNGYELNGLIYTVKI
jgi:hypothetical protein